MCGAPLPSHCLGPSPARSFLITLAVTRSVYFAIEQPLDSFMYHLEAISSTLYVTGHSRVVSWMGAFGAQTPKPLEFRGTAPFISSFRRSKKQADARLGIRKVRLYFNQKRVSKKSSGWRKSGWTTGAKGRLKLSQTYPRDFSSLLASLVASTVAAKQVCAV